MLGADLMAQAVERQGVRTVFGLPGHLESFFGAVDRRGMRLIHMRHESAVVLAADGYAQTRRSLGVACVTSGPGLANAVGGIASANDSGTPLIVFAGRNPFAMLDARPQQELDHVRLVRSITKWSQVVHDPSRLGEYVDMAARVALSGDPGPVLLEIPRDVATGTVDEAEAAQSLGPVIRAHAPRPAADDVARAVALLAKAKRPLLVTGRGAYWSRAGDAMRRLNREFGMPILQAASSRGLVPEDFETVFRWPIGRGRPREADVVILAGARMEGSIDFAAPPLLQRPMRCSFKSKTTPPKLAVTAWLKRRWPATRALDSRQLPTASQRKRLPLGMRGGQRSRSRRGWRRSPNAAWPKTGKFIRCAWPANRQTHGARCAVLRRRRRELQQLV